MTLRIKENEYCTVYGCPQMATWFKFAESGIIYPTRYCDEHYKKFVKYFYPDSTDEWNRLGEFTEEKITIPTEFLEKAERAINELEQSGYDKDAIKSMKKGMDDLKHGRFKRIA